MNDGAGPPTVVVVGLGPAGKELVTAAGAAALQAHPAERRWSRTDRHPAVEVLGDHHSFDDVYEEAEQLDDVYPTIVDRLVEQAATPRLGLLRRARLAARGRAHRRVAALARPCSAVRSPSRSSRPCPSSTWPGPVSASTRSPPGSAWSTATASPPRPPVSGARCWWASATTATCSPTSSSPSRNPPAATVTVLQHLGLPDEVVVERGLGRPRPRRSTPTTSPRCGSPAGRAGGGRAGPLRRAGPHAAPSVPVGLGADPSSLAALPGGGGLRGPRRHRRARRPSSSSRRRRRCRGRVAGGAGRPALPGRLPRHHRRRAGLVHPGRRGPRHPRQAVRRHPHVFGDVAVGRCRGRGPELGRDQGRGEGPNRALRRYPGGLPGPALRREGAPSGGQGGSHGRPHRCVRHAGSRPKPPLQRARLAGLWPGIDAEGRVRVAACVAATNVSSVTREQCSDE